MCLSKNKFFKCQTFIYTKSFTSFKNAQYSNDFRIKDYRNYYLLIISSIVFTNDILIDVNIK